MSGIRRRRLLLLLLFVPLLRAQPGPAHDEPKPASPAHGHGPTPAGHEGHKGPAASPSGGPTYITSEALHAAGGVPPGWKFALPPGNPEAGREAFIAFECYKCHTVAGEKFPAHEGSAEDVGPDLTGMGGHHPPEYFAESIMNPNTVILDEPGFTGPDRLSKMPNYLDSMTLRQLVDLVAYLQTLTPGKAHPASAQEAPQLVEGEGEVRIVNAEDKMLVVKHGEIKGFMGAMTMGYPVTSPDLLKGLQKGDRIRFKIDPAKQVITEITKVK